MRNKLTFDIVSHMLPAQRDMIDTLLGAEKESVSSGALSLDYEVSSLAVSGTKAYTLAAPTFAGQRKRVECGSAASTPVGTLTISSPDTTTGYVCSATFIFDTAGQAIELIATTGLLWRCVRVQRAGSLAVVTGTTVLTSYNLAQNYALSVDGTVSSTSTKALPNGSAVGERCTVTCSTAANTPVGSIDGVFAGMTGTAYTHLGAIGVAASTTVTGDYAMLEWSGTAWLVVTQSGCTLS